MSILDTALESFQGDEKPSEKLIVMQGPLSEIIYRALNVAFRKDGDNFEDNLSLESAAQEVTIAKKIIETLSDDGADNNESADFVVFGVEKKDVDPNTVVEVQDIIKTKDKASELILVMTPTITGASKDVTDHAPLVGSSTTNSELSETVTTLVQATLESLVKENNGTVLHDLNSLIEYIR